MASEIAADTDPARRAYQAMAPIYDEFTAHHDYELWLGNILVELERHGLAGRRLLDVACGTGKSFLPMLGRGWSVTGCDISPEALAIARAKSPSSVSLSVSDMRGLPPLGAFDLVWALGDAMNYLRDRDELERSLVGMRGNLAPGGMVAFDLNTLRTYRTFWAETQVIERNGMRFTWEGTAAPDAGPGALCEAHLRVEATDEGQLEIVDSVPDHSHRQQHFPANEVVASLEGAGLECLDVLGHGLDAVFRQPLDERLHTKAFYIARHAEP